MGQCQAKQTQKVRVNDMFLLIVLLIQPLAFAEGYTKIEGHLLRSNDKVCVIRHQKVEYALLKSKLRPEELKVLNGRDAAIGRMIKINPSIRAVLYARKTN